MNPEKRCNDWYHELFAVKDNPEAVAEKIIHILDVLVTDNDDTIAFATMRSLLTIRELPTLPDITQSSPNFNKFFVRYSSYILSKAKDLDRQYYTINSLLDDKDNDN